MRNIIRVVNIGTVKSSQVLGESNSIKVAKALVIKDKTNAKLSEMGVLFIGLVTPKRVKEIIHKIKPLIKNANEPSSVL